MQVLGMIEIEILLTFVYFLECTAVEILMHWMSVKLADNFQIREHSWPCLFQWMERASLHSTAVHSKKYTKVSKISIEIYWGRLLTFITESSSRLLRIRFSADLTMYWFPVCHFRYMKFKPLVIWIWNQNIAIHFTTVHSKKYTKVSNISISIIPRIYMI
jgi:hypothetical protein